MAIVPPEENSFLALLEGRRLIFLGERRIDLRRTPAEIKKRNAWMKVEGEMRPVFAASVMQRLHGGDWRVRRIEGIGERTLELRQIDSASVRSLGRYPEHEVWHARAIPSRI